MSLPPAGPRLSILVAALSILVLLPACTVEAGDDAAHAIAEKFAAEGEPASGAQSEMKTATSEPTAEISAVVLPTAQSEPAVKIISQPLPESKPPATEKKPAPTERKPTLPVSKPSAVERKQAETKRKAQEKAEQERRAKAQRKADEQDMLAHARAEAEERRIAQEKRLQEIERAEAEAEARRVRIAEDRARKLAEEKRAAEAEEARKAAEARHLAELREREAEERQKAEDSRRVAEIAAREETRRIAEIRQREAEEKQKAEEARRLAEISARDEARRIADQQRIAEEERARRDAEARRLVEADMHRRAAEERRIAAERMLAEEEARRTTQARALSEFAERSRQAELARQYDIEEARVVRHEVTRLEEERDAESRRLADRLQHIRDNRPDNALTLLPPLGLGGPLPVDQASDYSDDIPAVRSSTRVTILLLMEPGNRGIRRFNKTGDPILCLDRSCYVSRGSAAPADEISRGRAFGPGVALGSRAGSCANALTCVFRNVDLGSSSAKIQPIDLRLVRHDRREISTAESDRTCRVQSGQLVCRRPVIAGSYTLWVVPEAIAERAGAMALETAVRSDSFYDHSASLNR